MLNEINFIKHIHILYEVISFVYSIIYCLIFYSVNIILNKILFIKTVFDFKGKGENLYN